jgi:ParB family transcriptional regulator, chromosome partitioning protein
MKQSGVDLSGLDDFNSISFGSLLKGEVFQHGKPMMIALADIVEDPEQPRIEFSEESLKEMEDSIRERGVKTPISVKAHPTLSEKWILNHGARRYRGSVKAGKTHIPAFIDESHDNYDQIIENIQRENLTPMEIAVFIHRRLTIGDKKGEIAKKLGKPNSFITKHAALINLPASIQTAYDNGYCRDVEALYELAKNYPDFSDEIDQICQSTEVISKYTVYKLINQHSTIKQEDPSKESLGNLAGSAVPHQATEGKKARNNLKKSTPQSTKPFTDINSIRLPIVQIEHQDRPAHLLLDRLTIPGLAWITYQDTHENAEVETEHIKLLAIVEKE